MSKPASDEIDIVPPHRLSFVDFGEIWRYRELAFFLGWRDTAVRYRQTAIGVLWAIIQPLTTMLLFTVIFGRMAKLPSGGVPYDVFTLTAILPWQFCSTSLAQCTNSLIDSSKLLTKVYFPRLIIPLASIMPCIVDFACAFVVLFCLLLIRGVVLTPHAVLAFAYLVLALVTVLGVGLLLGALSVKYRDARYMLPFLTQIWLFACPVAYSSTLVPPEWRIVYCLNPMATVIEGFRWTLLNTPNLFGVAETVTSIVSAFVLLFSGLLYFSSVERSFADHI